MFAYRLRMGFALTVGLLWATTLFANQTRHVQLHTSHHDTHVMYDGKKSPPQGHGKQGEKGKQPTDDQKKPGLHPFDTSHNKLNRGYVNAGDITHVDTYTGNMVLHLPLVRIPGNDSLPLNVMLTFNNHLQSSFLLDHLSNRMGHVGYGWTDFVGIYTAPDVTIPPPDQFTPPANMSFYNPVFIDPIGKPHHFYRYQLLGQQARNGDLYPSATYAYISNDNWYGVFQLDYNGSVNGTRISLIKANLTAPDGTQYQVVGNHLMSITSPNKGTVITYHYDNKGDIASITRNDGFTVTFNTTNAGWNGDSTLRSIQTSDGRTWSFDYQAAPCPSGAPCNWDHAPPTLKQITLPNQSTWQFTAISLGADNDDTAPLKGYPALPDIAINHIISPTGLHTDLMYGDNFSYNQHPVYIYDRVATPYVKSKTLSGPGVPSGTWHYRFPAMTTTYVPDAGDYWMFGTQTTVTGPTQKTLYTFVPQQFAQDPTGQAGVPVPAATASTGTLLKKVDYDLSGHIIQTTTYDWGERVLSRYLPFYDMTPYVTALIGQQLPSQLTIPELQGKTITRGTATYSQTFSKFDAYGNPGHEVDSSPQGTKSEDLTYYENTTGGKWILKPANVTTYDNAGAVADTVTQSFDGNGNLLSASHNGVTTRFTYDSAGNKLTQTDADGNITHFANYVAGLPQTITDPLGNVTKEVVNQNGTVTSKTTPKGETTTYTYGPLYRLTGITPPIHLPTTLSWTDNANGTTVVMTRGKDVTTIHNNSLGGTLSNEETDGTAGHATYQTFDALNRVISKTYPTTLGNTGVTPITTTYDALNRPLVITQPGGFTTTYTYDDNTHSVTVTDANSHVTTYHYRAFDNPDQKQLMAIDQPEGITTTYTRTIMGKPLSITQGNLTRTFTYDSHQYVHSETDPEIGTTVYGRDAMGNMISKQVGTQKATTSTFDADNRLKTTTYTDVSGNAQTITQTYDPDGHVLTKTNTGNANNWVYSYDANGNILSKVLTVGTHKTAFATTYDGYDHVATRTLPNGLGLTYGVNPLGQIQAITGNTGTKKPYVSGIHYFPDNHIQSMTYGNGVTTTYTENSRDMRDSIVAKKGATTFISKQYTYDGVGNILAIVDNVDTKNSQTMGYDGVNRLIEAKGTWGDMQLSYDVNSNLTSRQIDQAVSTYHYNSHNQLASISGAGAQSFGTTNGDMTHIGGLKLAYNTLQEVEAVGGTGVAGKAVNDSFGYDGNGNRVFATQNGKTLYEAYNQKDQLLYQDDTSTGTEHDYISLGGHVVVQLKTKGSVTTPVYLGDNLLGSTLVATTQTGATKWTENYKPYGDELIKNKDRDNPHVGYTGKPHDDVTGLSYYGHRWYSPTIGRFISPDPAPINTAKPMTFNRYAYANDNPYRYVDPLGSESESSNKDKSSDNDNNNDNHKSTHSTARTIASVGMVGVTAVGIVGTIVSGGLSDVAAAELDAGILEAEGLEETTAVSNSVPKTFARAVPGRMGKVPTLGPPGDARVFVTDANALKGLSAKQIAEKLSIEESESFNVYEFPSNSVSDITSPIVHDDPNFVGQGVTKGGAPEFTISNGPIPAEATIRNVR